MPFWQRLLAFESYVGFQHDAFGVIAGLIVALDLWVHGSLAGPRHRALTPEDHRPQV